MQKKLIRAKARDVAFQYRMGAGFPGDVNRTHPAEIEAALVDADDPAGRYGDAVLIDTVTGGARAFRAADASDAVDAYAFGAVVRPFPFQTPVGSASSQGLGVGVPPTSGLIDLLRNGLIMAQLNTGSTAPKKGGRVYIWCAATAGNHVQGGYETEASAGNTVRLDARFTYNGGMDASNVAEISFNV